MPPRKVLLKSSEDFQGLQPNFQMIKLTKFILISLYILFFLSEFLNYIIGLPTR